METDATSHNIVSPTMLGVVGTCCVVHANERNNCQYCWRLSKIAMHFGTVILRKITMRIHRRFHEVNKSFQSLVTSSLSHSYSFTQNKKDRILFLLFRAASYCTNSATASSVCKKYIDVKLKSILCPKFSGFRL